MRVFLENVVRHYDRGHADLASLVALANGAPLSDEIEFPVPIQNASCCRILPVFR